MLQITFSIALLEGNVKCFVASFQTVAVYFMTVTHSYCPNYIIHKPFAGNMNFFVTYEVPHSQSFNYNLSPVISFLMELYCMNVLI